MITLKQFADITDKIAAGIEGGYFHRDMLKKMKPSDVSKLGKSGETMLGIDRVNGTQLATFPEWAKFWAIIDKANARYNWKYNYMGGQYHDELKNLARTIMYKWYSKLAGRYLTDKSLQAVDKDKRLQLHFSYAAWNGERWFKKMAQVTNTDTAAGRDVETIAKNAINYRLNNSEPLIRQSGAKIKTMFDQIGKPVSPGLGAIAAKGSGLIPLVIAAVVIFTIIKK